VRAGSKAPAVYKTSAALETFLAGPIAAETRRSRAAAAEKEAGK